MGSDTRNVVIDMKGKTTESLYQNSTPAVEAAPPSLYQAIFA